MNSILGIKIKVFLKDNKIINYNQIKKIIFFID